MRRLRDHQSWCLFDPVDVPLLLSTYGQEFADAYETYEKTVTPLERTSTMDIWTAICRAQQESGTPFIMFPDAINSEYNSRLCYATTTEGPLFSEEQPEPSRYHPQLQSMHRDSPVLGRDTDGDMHTCICRRRSLRPTRS